MRLLAEIARICFDRSRRVFQTAELCLKDVFRLVEDRLWDARLGIRTCYDDRGLAERSAHRDEVIYRATSYHRLRLLMNYLRPGPEDVLVDYGCGKGRVLAVAARENIQKAVGIELQPKLAALARENMKSLKGRRSPVEIVNMDASEFDPIEGTIFFLYDPFKYRTFTSVIWRLRASFENKPRALRIAYFDPRYPEILDAEPWLRPLGEIGHSRIFVWRGKL